MGGNCSPGDYREGCSMPIGSFAANVFGLYDMVGNIRWWLAAIYVDVADESPVATVTGRAGDINRVLVGGSSMTQGDGPVWVACRHGDRLDLHHWYPWLAKHVPNHRRLLHLGHAARHGS